MQSSNDKNQMRCEALLDKLCLERARRYASSLRSPLQLPPASRGSGNKAWAGKRAAPIGIDIPITCHSQHRLANRTSDYFGPSSLQTDTPVDKYVFSRERSHRMACRVTTRTRKVPDEHLLAILTCFTLSGKVAPSNLRNRMQRDAIRRHRPSMNQQEPRHVCKRRSDIRRDISNTVCTKRSTFPDCA